MSDFIEAADVRPLEFLAHEIAVRAKKADDYVVSAALLFREVRARIERGELGPDVKWRGWMCKNIKLSESRLFELMRIAEAHNPFEELERSRRLNREKQKTFREKTKALKIEAQKVELDPERVEMIKWSKAAPFEDVCMIRNHIVGLQEARDASAKNGQANNSEAEVRHLH